MQLHLSIPQPWYRYSAYTGSIHDFSLGGEDCMGAFVHPFEGLKIKCSKMDSGGFLQLADYRVVTSAEKHRTALIDICMVFPVITSYITHLCRSLF